jgi:hypothetical protein
MREVGFKRLLGTALHLILVLAGHAFANDGVAIAQNTVMSGNAWTKCWFEALRAQFSSALAQDGSQEAGIVRYHMENEQTDLVNK